MAQAMTVDTLAAVRVELAALIAAIDVKAPHGYPRGQPTNAIHDWLAMLREAVGSDAQGVDACHAVAAVCSARLAA